jgi:hypothetical protein
MNIIYQGLFTLVKSALTGEKLNLPEGFELEKAAPLIKRHALIPLVYPGAINCGIPPKAELMQKMQVHYFRHLITSDRQMQAVKRLCDAFEAEGIDYMLLKGVTLKSLYPKPEMRSMGDADVLIRLDQYERIVPIMEAMAYKKVKESVYDFVWQVPELYLELHRRLYATTQTVFCDYFGTGWEVAVKGEGHSYHMSREDEFAYIFSHMAKHFRIRGIGLRHFIDLYVYRKTYQLDEARVEQIMDKLQMRDFYRNVCRTLDVWFEGRRNDDVTDMITEYVFDSGSFGTMENKLYYQQLSKANQKKRGIHNSKADSMAEALFPPLALMQDSYNVLFRYPILLPVYWPVRWVDVLIHRRTHVGQKMKIIREMSDEKLQLRERAMNMMGVSFDCVDDEED